MNFLSSICLLLLLVFKSQLLLAETLKDHYFDATSEMNSSSEARSDAFKQAVESVSKKYIESMIGPEKWLQQKEVIEKKVIAESGKYIPYLRATQLNKTEAGYQVSVHLKFSQDSLRRLLLQQGLLYQSTGSPKILPLISFEDHINAQGYAWWVRESSSEFLRHVGKGFFEQLKQDMRKKGFYSLQPVGFRLLQMIPAKDRMEQPSRDALQRLANRLDYSVVLKGTVQMRALETGNYQLAVKLKALSATYGRTIATIDREYNSGPGPFQTEIQKLWSKHSTEISAELANQILLAWQKGTFGAALVQIAVTGKLTRKQWQAFRKTLLNEIQPLKSLRERLIADDSVLFEADSSQSLQEVQRLIRNKKFPRFKVEVGSVRSERLSLRVRAL